MRILLVDDHFIVRQGMKELLTHAFEEAVFGEARSAEEAQPLVRTQPWDVAIVDISLPGQSGLAFVKHLKQKQPRLPVLVFSMHAEDFYAVRALKAGADGYVMKDAEARELVTAVKRVLQGRKYVSGSLAEKLAVEVQVESPKPLHESLSEREFEVFRLLASGKTISQIALVLSLSVKTVSTYRSRILAKMQMKNNVELVQYAIRNQLIQ